jgi:tetratricopeptide (TPR) repeat protein
LKKLLFLIQGKGLCILGRYDEALKSFDSALNIDPSYVDAHNYKGIALRNQGQYDEASQSFKNAFDLNPNNAITCYNKGNLFNELGKYEKAMD